MYRVRLRRAPSGFPDLLPVLSPTPERVNLGGEFTEAFRVDVPSLNFTERRAVVSAMAHFAHTSDAQMRKRILEQGLTIRASWVDLILQ